MSDTHAACMNLVNALEKIPGIIAQHEERTAKLKADVPLLEAIIAKPWGKEDELKQLKSDLATLDRKITAELAPHNIKRNRTARITNRSIHLRFPKQILVVSLHQVTQIRLWLQNRPLHTIMEV